MQLPTRLASGIFAAALPFAGLLASSTPASAAATGPGAHIALPAKVVDCQGDAAEVRPRTIVYACGDGGVVAVRLHWTHWGQRRAHATGLLAVNDCTPNCAYGHYHYHRAEVTLSRLHTFADGRTRYRYVTIYSGPAGEPGSVLRDSLPG